MQAWCSKDRVTVWDGAWVRTVRTFQGQTISRTPVVASSVAEIAASMAFANVGFRCRDLRISSSIPFLVGRSLLGLSHTTEVHLSICGSVLKIGKKKILVQVVFF
jgi:hypothetical protein